MKLLDYVVQNDEDIFNFKASASMHEMSVEEYILEGYCPSNFNILTNSPYEKPFKMYKYDKSDCSYRFIDNFKKCKECWNREVLVTR